jgi:hypothetical protein
MVLEVVIVNEMGELWIEIAVFLIFLDSEIPHAVIELFNIGEVVEVLSAHLDLVMLCVLVPNVVIALQKLSLVR